MEKMIERLYQAHLQEEQLPFGVPNRENKQKECEIYCLLSEELPQPMRELLRDYDGLIEERHEAELQTAYEHGFKTAIKLILEGVKD